MYSLYIYIYPLATRYKFGFVWENRKIIVVSFFLNVMFDDRRDPDGSLYNSSFLRYLKLLFQKISSTSSKHAQKI